MKWKQQLFGMKAYQPGKPMDEVKKQFGLDEVVKLASNENPFGSSPKVPKPIIPIFNFAINNSPC